jgi:hypothetical protein
VQQYFMDETKLAANYSSDATVEAGATVVRASAQGFAPTLTKRSGKVFIVELNLSREPNRRTVSVW